MSYASFSQEMASQRLTWFFVSGVSVCPFVGGMVLLWVCFLKDSAPFPLPSRVRWLFDLLWRRDLGSAWRATVFMCCVYSRLKVFLCEVCVCFRRAGAFVGVGGSSCRHGADEVMLLDPLLLFVFVLAAHLEGPYLPAYPSFLLLDYLNPLLALLPPLPRVWQS